MEDCIFCKIVGGEIKDVRIWEDEKYIAFLDMRQISPGHTLLIPKKHTDYLFDMEDNEYCELMLKAKEISKKLKLKLKTKKIGLAVEGFGVPHAHIHLIPINKGGEICLERDTHPKIEELKKMAEQINGK